MIRYNLNTGQTCHSPRSEVSNEDIVACLPLIDGGPIPFYPLLRIETVLGSGSGMFTVFYEKYPIKHCAAVWAREGEAKAWSLVKKLYLPMDVTSTRHRDLRKPTALPWLGVAATPLTPLLACESLCWLSGFTVRMAWTLIEAQKTNGKYRHAAKLVRTSGEVIAIYPRNGRAFTARESRQHVGGPIQIIRPTGFGTTVMVVGRNARLGPHPVPNAPATRLWREACMPGSPASRESVIGDAVFCHASQVHYCPSGRF